MREKNARGMAKRLAFVEVQIKRQEKRARNEWTQQALKLRGMAFC